MSVSTFSLKQRIFQLDGGVLMTTEMIITYRECASQHVAALCIEEHAVVNGWLRELNHIDVDVEFLANS